MSEPTATCWTLIEGAAGGDEVDRERFASRYGSVVRATLAARWRGSGRDADLEDAIQEVFLECFKEGGALQTAEPGRRGGFRGFLFGVVRNVAHRHDERRGRRREVTMDTGITPPGQDTGRGEMEKAFDRAWARQILRMAAEHQATMARRRGESAMRRVELLRLRFDDGLPMREIATRWDTTREKLKDDYDQARIEFERSLKDVVAFHLPGMQEEVDRECRNLLGLLGRSA